MKKLKVVSINNYNYSLKDEQENNYDIIIEFYDLKEPPKVGEYIYISNRLLNEKMLYFGPIGSKYGRNITDENDEDILVLLKENERIYLQRYYG